MVIVDGNEFLPKEDERCKYLDIIKGEPIVTKHKQYINLPAYFCIKYQKQLSVDSKSQPRECQSCDNKI